MTRDDRVLESICNLNSTKSSYHLISVPLSTRVKEPRSVSQDSLPSPEDLVLQIINDGWLVLLLSIGERAGLLEYLATNGPVGVGDMSVDTRIPARYLLEWCWGLVAGGLLDYDNGGRTFAIRPGFENALTARGGPMHWSRISEQIVAFAGLEDDLLQCFRTGGGIDSSRYEGRVADVMDLESGTIFDQILLTQLIPAIGCQDALERGVKVVDLGCGSGRLLVTLAAVYRRSRFTGYDLSVSALEKARARAEDAGLGNCHFEQRDLEPLKLDDTYDLAFCCNTAHDLPSPRTFFADLVPRLSSDGVLVLQELHSSTDMTENSLNPLAPGILGFSLLHCLPLALGKDPTACVPGARTTTSRLSRRLASALSRARS